MEFPFAQLKTHILWKTVGDSRSLFPLENSFPLQLSGEAIFPPSTEAAVPQNPGQEWVPWVGEGTGLEESGGDLVGAGLALWHPQAQGERNVTLATKGI